MTLHCPAVVIVARHGEAQYPHPHDRLGDEGGRLTDRGREQSRALGAALAQRRIAAVYTSSHSRAAETGSIAASVLGVPVRTAHGLQEFGVGDLAGEPIDGERLTGTYAAWLAGDRERRIPGGESGWEVVRRTEEALQGIADLHRGEIVLVISHGGVMSLCLPRIGGIRRIGAPPAPPANCAWVELEFGDDGTRLASWPG